ncbi:protein takeout-like isoform X2 [Periplaneta americana]|uniref:protein takeout-like isoform X2 n=1 Tax=Periplaneta americana TaxID=6978 RepID=UPI0037E95D83
MRYSSLILFVLCTGVTNGALPLPSYIKPCARNDPKLYECSAKHGNDAIPHIIKGDPKYKLPSLDPLKIDEIKVAEGERTQAGFTLVVKDASIYGAKDMHVEKVEYDLNRKHIFHQVFVPRVEIIGKYEVYGRLLLLPINGHGDINITLDNCRITYDADFSYETIDGKDHISQRNQKTQANPENMHIKLTNLFNGDKMLNKQMNEFLNQNWWKVFNELSPTVFSMFTRIIFMIMIVYPFIQCC